MVSKDLIGFFLFHSTEKRRRRKSGGYSDASFSERNFSIIFHLT